LGKDCVNLVPPVMGSEDFGLLADALGVPSVYWMFGAYTQERLDGSAPLPGNHSPYFAPDIEPTLSTGVRAALTSILSRVGGSGVL
jgi:metal-dependent amidase/aminoacylase/carboxypeptidase family protein